MNSIELIDHCFGSDVRIDGESLFISEYDTRSEEYVRNLKINLINELIKVIDRVNTTDLRYIAEIVTTCSDDWDYSEDESDEGSSCDQCGNWNYLNKYIKKENDQG